MHKWCNVYGKLNIANSFKEMFKIISSYLYFQALLIIWQKMFWIKVNRHSVFSKFQYKQCLNNVFFIQNSRSPQFLHVIHFCTIEYLSYAFNDVLYCAILYYTTILYCDFMIWNNADIIIVAKSVCVPGSLCGD